MLRSSSKSFNILLGTHLLECKVPGLAEDGDMNSFSVLVDECSIEYSVKDMILDISTNCLIAFSF